jgi:hypothetical protein
MGRTGTADDTVFKSLDDIRAALGTFPGAISRAKSFRFRSRIPSYESLALGGPSDVTRVIQLVFRRAGTTPQLITWKEF